MALRLLPGLLKTGAIAVGVYAAILGILTQSNLNRASVTQQHR